MTKKPVKVGAYVTGGYIDPSKIEIDGLAKDLMKQTDLIRSSISDINFKLSQLQGDIRAYGQFNARKK